MCILAQSKFALDQLRCKAPNDSDLIFANFCLHFLGRWPKKKSMQHHSDIRWTSCIHLVSLFTNLPQKSWRSGAFIFYIITSIIFKTACTGWGRVVSVLTIFLLLQRKINPQDKVRREKQNRPNIFQVDEMWRRKTSVLPSGTMHYILSKLRLRNHP